MNVVHQLLAKQLPTEKTIAALLRRMGFRVGSSNRWFANREQAEKYRKKHGIRDEVRDVTKGNTYRSAKKIKDEWGDEIKARAVRLIGHYEGKPVKSWQSKLSSLRRKVSSQQIDANSMPKLDEIAATLSEEFQIDIDSSKLFSMLFDEQSTVEKHRRIEKPKYDYDDGLDYSGINFPFGYNVY